MRIRSPFHFSRGFTLIEVAITVVVILVLSALLYPLISSYLLQARITAARSDVQAIAEAILRFERDTGRFPMFRTPGQFMPDSNAVVVRLEGPGGSGPTTTPANDWTLSSGFSSCSGGSCTVHTMGVLLSNDLGYPTTSSLGKPFKWKGPYIAAAADPWGNKYLVNIINAKSSSTAAVFVLSGGPDGIIQTPFSPLRTTTNFTSGASSSDDIIYRIR